MSSEPTSKSSGLEELLKRPLLETIWRRRTHRVSRGVSVVKAGSMTYESTQNPLPLTELEEAVLIAVTGHTGLTMPDRPFQDPKSDEFIMAKPNLTMDGRTAGSPDNAQLHAFRTRIRLQQNAAMEQFASGPFARRHHFP